MVTITSLKRLKELSSMSDGCDCFIQLNFGLRSDKHIAWNDGKWYVYNNIDDSEQVLTTRQLKKETNIIEAIAKGMLFLDD